MAGSNPRFSHGGMMGRHKINREEYAKKIQITTQDGFATAGTSKPPEVDPKIRQERELAPVVEQSKKESVVFLGLGNVLLCGRMISFRNNQYATNDEKIIAALRDKGYKEVE